MLYLIYILTFRVEMSNNPEKIISTFIPPGKQVKILILKAYLRIV